MAHDPLGYGGAPIHLPSPPPSPGGWIVDCPGCGVTYDDGEEMVECEACNVWAHVSCLKARFADKLNLDQYVCPSCQTAKNERNSAGKKSAEHDAADDSARRNNNAQGGGADDQNNNDHAGARAKHMQNKGSIPGRRFFKVQQKMGISDEELVRRQRAFFAKGAPCFIKAGLWNARALEPKLLGERRDAFLRTLDDEAEAWQEKRREEAEKRQQERAERARLRDMRTPYSMRLEACQRFDEEEEERREEEEAARRAEAGEDEQMEDEQEEQVVDEEQRRLDEEQRKLQEQQEEEEKQRRLEERRKRRQPQQQKEKEKEKAEKEKEKREEEKKVEKTEKREDENKVDSASNGNAHGDKEKAAASEPKMNGAPANGEAVMEDVPASEQVKAAGDKKMPSSPGPQDSPVDVLQSPADVPHSPSTPHGASERQGDGGEGVTSPKPAEKPKEDAADATANIKEPSRANSAAAASPAPRSAAKKAMEKMASPAPAAPSPAREEGAATTPVRQRKEKASAKSSAAAEPPPPANGPGDASEGGSGAPGAGSKRPRGAVEEEPAEVGTTPKPSPRTPRNARRTRGPGEATTPASAAAAAAEAGDATAQEAPPATPADEKLTPAATAPGVTDAAVTDEEYALRLHQMLNAVPTRERKTRRLQ